MAKILLLTILLSITSCSEEKRYSASQMWRMAQTKDPNIELIIVTDPTKRILCENYKAKGCIKGSGKRIKVRLVDLIAIEFDTEENAKEAARTYNQYYAKNWFFDDVRGEPVLESFIKEVYDAKNPVESK